MQKHIKGDVDAKHTDTSAHIINSMPSMMKDGGWRGPNQAGHKGTLLSRRVVLVKLARKKVAQEEATKA